MRWIEPQAKGQEEPENPAPALELSAATEDHHGGAAADDSATAGDDKAATAASSSDSSSEGSSGSDTTARALGVAGIVVGAAGVAFGVLAGRRRTNS